MPVPRACARGSPGLRQLLHFAGRPATTTLSIVAPRPRPKCSRRWFCAQKPDAAGHFLHLLLAVPEHRHLRADRAAIRARRLRRCRSQAPSSSNAIQCAIRRHLVLYSSSGPRWLATTTSSTPRFDEVGERDRAAVVAIGGADHLGDVDEAAGAVVDPDLLLLIAGQAARAHRRPVLRVGDDDLVAAGDLRVVVPVAVVLRRRDVAVGEVEVEEAVVVEIAELRAEAPAAELDAHRARHVLVLRQPRARRRSAPRGCCPGAGCLLRRCSRRRWRTALVEHVADRRVHAALRRVADAGFAADLAELPALVDEQLRDAVVVGDEEVGIAGAAQVGGDRGQRPAARRRGPTCSLTSSKRPPPRLWNRYFRPPLFAYSKLSGIIFVSASFQRFTYSG